jgi:hypothetical protein
MGGLVESFFAATSSGTIVGYMSNFTTFVPLKCSIELVQAQKAMHKFSDPAFARCLVLVLVFSARFNVWC